LDSATSAAFSSQSEGGWRMDVSHHGDKAVFNNGMTNGLTPLSDPERHASSEWVGWQLDLVIVQLVKWQEFCQKMSNLDSQKLCVSQLMTDRVRIQTLSSEKSAHRRLISPPGTKMWWESRDVTSK
jgi:hypothetical protein